MELISGAIIKRPALGATVPKHLLYSQCTATGGQVSGSGTPHLAPGWGAALLVTPALPPTAWRRPHLDINCHGSSTAIFVHNYFIICFDCDSLSLYILCKYFLSGEYVYENYLEFCLTIQNVRVFY